ncbi:MAG: 4Fe-4S dicluster domain-containing protein [Bacteroidetes bacterium]|nr:4Fe-4S dicluster domain-containing protein [Bacteroidota bacterium]
MQTKKQTRDFHHALAVQADLCTGCTHCMAVCPTRAIRIRNGKAIILANRCVDCGECYKACPVSAIAVEQDDLQMIFRFPVRVILIPSILIGQFPRKIMASSIYNALKEIGFTHVFEVENTVDMVIEAGRQIMLENKERPVISSFCPAIVRLIQVKFPSLVDNILKVNPPIDMSAMYYREKLKMSGIPAENIGLFYATPCAAKIAAVKSPVGEIESAIDGVINMDLLYNRILNYLQRKYTETTPPETDDLLSSRGILWSTTRGEAIHSAGRALAIDGIQNVNEFLENIENEKLDKIDFLELRACDESCAGGILMSGNRFLTVERLKNRSDEYRAREDDKIRKVQDGYLDITEHGFLGNIEPRPIEKLDEDISAALKKVERKRRMMCYLPGFDCGGCGAPDCQTLAEDIVTGNGQISQCIFLQQQMIKQNLLSQSQAVKITGDIWGKERLEKNCNKIGAENENN